MSARPRAFRISYFARKPHPGQVSIERVFATVVGALPPQVSTRLWECPASGTSVRSILRNLRTAGGCQAEINHITGDVHYLAGALHPRRTVLTIHDFVSLHRLTGFRRSLFRFLWYTMPLRRAAVVTVPSEATGAELIRLFPSCRTPVVVVPNPVHPGFHPQPKPFPKKPNFLFLGTKPNKNLLRVAEALRGLPCSLTVLGKLSIEQRELLDQCGVETVNRFDLTDAEVVQCYAHCDAVLFPSTYEGFGLPIIEAQAIARPVLTSDLVPMRDVAGGAAHLTDPFDVSDIRAGVLRLIEDTAHRENLVQAGLRNAEKYRPEKVAAEYLAVYENLLERAA